MPLFYLAIFETRKPRNYCDGYYTIHVHTLHILAKNTQINFTASSYRKYNVMLYLCTKCKKLYKVRQIKIFFESAYDYPAVWIGLGLEISLDLL